jgi:YidC/Oxa1 family membrane protein insertase
MDNEKRLVIAIALSVVILVAFAWLSPKPERQPQPVTSEPTAIERPVRPSAEAERQPPTPASEANETDEASGDAGQDEPAITAEREEEIRVDNGLFEVVFTNRGGRAKTWTLLHYTTADGAPLQLLPQFEEGGHHALSVDLDDRALTDELNNALYRVERERLPSDGSTGGERIKFLWSDGRGLVVEKTFDFRQGDYLVDAWLDVLDRGRRLPARLTLGPGFAAQEPSSSHSNYYYESQGAWDVAGQVTRRKRGKLDGEGGFSGPVHWAGLEDQYFTSLILPNDSPAEVRWKNPALTLIPVKGEELDEAPEPRPEPVVAVSVTGGGAQLFIGPKKHDLLKTIGADRDLDEAVWFSSQAWLRVIVKFLFMCLVWIHDNVTQNWGMAIVLATVVLRLVLFPVNQYSMVSMKKTQLQMGKLQPKIKAIRNKYKKAKDAQSKGKMNQEMMELYKREGVNPMGGMSGCLPLLAQFPILIGFYNMLTVAVELRGAPFFGWIQDLSQEDPYMILPILMAVTMFAQQKLALSKIKDPQQLQQQRMMLFMPIVFGFICLQMPSGLVLYWFVNNLLGMGQQWLVNRHAGRLEAAAEQKA